MYRNAKCCGHCRKAEIFDGERRSTALIGQGSHAGATTGRPPGPGAWTRCPPPLDALLSVGEPVGPGGSACLGTAVRHSSLTEPDRSGRRRPLFLSNLQEVERGGYRTD